VAFERVTCDLRPSPRPDKKLQLTVVAKLTRNWWSTAVGSMIERAKMTRCSSYWWLSPSFAGT